MFPQVNTDLPQTSAPVHWAAAGVVSFLLSKHLQCEMPVAGRVCDLSLITALLVSVRINNASQAERQRNKRLVIHPGHIASKCWRQQNTKILLKTLTLSHCCPAWFGLVSSQNIYLLWCVDTTSSFCICLLMDLKFRNI